MFKSSKLKAPVEPLTSTIDEARLTQIPIERASICEMCFHLRKTIQKWLFEKRGTGCCHVTWLLLELYCAFALRSFAFAGSSCQHQISVHQRTLHLRSSQFSKILGSGSLVLFVCLIALWLGISQELGCRSPRDITTRWQARQTFEFGAPAVIHNTRASLLRYSSSRHI